MESLHLPSTYLGCPALIFMHAPCSHECARTHACLPPAGLSSCCPRDKHPQFPNDYPESGLHTIDTVYANSCDNGLASAQLQSAFQWNALGVTQN